MSTLLHSITQIDKKLLPAHIAIIMDGNGRWAKEQGYERIFGHQQAVKAVRSVIEGAGEAGISFLTLYAFSTENWNRPKEEVNALISLLIRCIEVELDDLMKNKVRLKAIGDLASLPIDCQEQLEMAIRKTEANTGLTVTLALSYSGRWEIENMAKKIATLASAGEITPQNVNTELISQHLATANMPDPDILIRTGGDTRISNFLLWQIAYTELFFSTMMWPDFRKENLWQIILDYLTRQRRFGKTGEQVASH